LFRQGIETLISQESGFEIVNPEMGLNAVVECIQTYRPDVVIVDYDDQELDLIPAVMCILRQRMGICVIGLSLRDNQISICRGEHKEVRQVEDLLKAIQD
jgi:DNA-binding NarL/FixJ family response regulator